MEKLGRGGSSETRPDSPSLKANTVWCSGFHTSLAGEPFLPVKFSVEAINIKHKRRAALVGDSCCVCQGRQIFLPRASQTSTGTQITWGSC